MHTSTAKAYEKLAVANVKQEMLEDGIKAYAKAINIRQMVLGDGNRHTKELMNTLESLECERKAENELGLAMKARVIRTMGFNFSMRRWIFSREDLELIPKWQQSTRILNKVCWKMALLRVQNPSRCIDEN